MRRISRRQFVQTATALGAGLYVSGSAFPAESSSPNEKLNIGVIGPGGRGAANLGGVSKENIVALCDADFRRAGKAFEEFPSAARYHDFREMLEKEKLDAVVVSTPDHTHAPASIMAMRLGLHCYCEKPLTHSVWEARLAARTAREYHVVTQMGTQIHAGENYRRVVEIIQSGAIGPVRQVHVWVGKNWGGGERPSDSPPVPEGLDWDVWLGPAPERPFHPTYVPANWRRWWDFGNGTLGDMGCHFIDLPFWALKLRHPTSVSAEGPAPHPETAPVGMRATWEFPARGDLPPVELTWSDGNMILNEHDGRTFPNSGVYFIGDEGTMFANYNSYKLFPEEKFQDYSPPPETIPRSIGHHAEWIQACKTGDETTCNFDYSGALTEMVLLGTVAYRLGKKLDWDWLELEARNAPEASPLIRRDEREGWVL
jgi:predicted dehydrogenase